MWPAATVVPLLAAGFVTARRYTVVSSGGSRWPAATESASVAAKTWRRACMTAATGPLRPPLQACFVLVAGSKNQFAEQSTSHAVTSHLLTRGVSQESYLGDPRRSENTQIHQ